MYLGLTCDDDERWEKYDIWHLFQQLLGALDGKIDRALVLIF